MWHLAGDTVIFGYLWIFLRVWCDGSAFSFWGGLRGLLLGVCLLPSTYTTQQEVLRSCKSTGVTNEELQYQARADIQQRTVVYAVGRVFADFRNALKRQHWLFLALSFDRDGSRKTRHLSLQSKT